MQADNTYDVAVIGGGLAGLAASILLQREGHNVVLIEKEQYPFHKVCGEYISLESRDFLERLGLPLHDMNLPIIKRFQLTAPNGSMFQTTLPLGGFGISRFTLDHQLSLIARQEGVTVLESTKVEEVHNQFRLICTSRERGKLFIEAPVCLAAWGKRSAVDVKLDRSFLRTKNRRLENYIGIKYHVKADWPQDLIALHNFKEGYCGISNIEEGKTCLCYLTTAQNLRNYKSIQEMQQEVLMQNRHLAKILKKAEVLQNFPVTISQISFASKTKVEGGILMLGDAAGMITPLCGNGMSIALHTGKLAAELVSPFLKAKISRQKMEADYQALWQQHFAARLQRGRLLQQFFGASWLSNSFVGLFKAFPVLAKPIIKSTHGEAF